MNKITLIALICLICTSAIVPAQNPKSQILNPKLDSLFLILKTTKADTTRVNTYIKICSQYQSSNPDTALYFGTLGLKLAISIPFGKERGWAKGIADCYINIGSIHDDQGNYPMAIEYYLKSLKIMEELGDKKGMSDCYNNIGNVHYYQGSYAQAIEYFLKSLKIDEESGNKKGMSDCYNNIGLVHYDQGFYDKAIEYYLKSIKIKEESGDKKGISACYMNIGLVHYDQGLYDKAIEYYLKSLKIDEESGDKKGMSDCYINIGNVYMYQGSYDNALEYYLKSLKIAKELGDKNGMAYCYGNIGMVHSSQGLYDKAIEYFLKDLKLDEELGDKNGIALVYGNIASLHIALADSTALSDNQQINYLNKAIEYGIKAIELAQEIKVMPIENEAANTLMRAYKKLGNFKKSIEYAEIFIATKDSMFSEEKTKALAEMGARYEAEKKQQEIEKQQILLEKKDAEVKKQLAISSKQKIVILFVVCGLLLMAVIAAIIFRSLRITRRQRNVIQKQKAVVDEKNRIIEQKNKDITDSITYAKRIQEAILTSSENCKKILPQHFILFKPKDIVSGDFYWAYASHNNNAIWTVADCTGHGVPGAFMSMIGSSLLNEIIIEKGIATANDILNELKKHIIKALGQTGITGETRDGMDASLCIWHKDTNILEFAGAYNPLYIVRNQQSAVGLRTADCRLPTADCELIEIKADRQPIGYHQGKEDSPFTKQEIQLQTGDTVYLFSDGYADQFGGEKSKKFSYKKFKDLLLSVQDRAMEQQKQILDETIEIWRGQQEQIDDICVIGVRI